MPILSLKHVWVDHGGIGGSSPEGFWFTKRFHCANSGCYVSCDCSVFLPINNTPEQWTEYISKISKLTRPNTEGCPRELKDERYTQY